MNVPIGIAGGRPQQLKPQERPALQGEGLYRAHTGPVIFQVLATTLPGELTAGLLLARPSIEGDAYIETEGGAYERQPVAFDLASSHHWANIAEVCFPMPDAAQTAASHLGIFGPDGRLLYYGWLARIGPSSSMRPGIRFAAGEIRIARIARQTRGRR